MKAIYVTIEDQLWAQGEVCDTTCPLQYLSIAFLEASKPFTTGLSGNQLQLFTAHWGDSSGS